MSERQKQTVFLKRLLQRDASEQQRELQGRIAQAERDEKSVRTAMNLVAVAGLLCLAGLCYEAIFVQDFFQNPTHLLTRIFCYVGLASILCWTLFLGYWGWYRMLTNRLCEEGRRLLITQAQQETVIVDFPECPSQTKEDNDHETRAMPVPKAA